jgi:hypothetical protein
VPNSKKTIKVDLNNDYPCPCRRKGRLLPITLTEAFGCDRCQQIFVLDENGQVIEQLSSSYPYKRAWRWTGYRWLPLRHNFSYGSFPLLVGIFSMMFMVGLMLAWRSQIGLLLWTILAVLLVVIPAIVFWLAYRR